MKMTVVTICYNSESAIDVTLDSVARVKQRYPDLQYVVIDGASNDETLIIIDSYRNVIDVLISEPDRGISDAFNKGIEYADGDYVMFLNAGDYYDAAEFSKMYTSCDGYDFVWANINWEHTGGVTRLVGSPVKRVKKLYQYVMVFNHPSVCAKRQLLNRVGKFSLDYKYAMDFDLMIRLMKVSTRYAYLDVTPVYMEAGGVHDANYWYTVNEVRRIAVSNGGNRLLAYLYMFYTYFSRKSSLLSKLRKRFIQWS